MCFCFENMTFLVTPNINCNKDRSEILAKPEQELWIRYISQETIIINQIMSIFSVY